MPGRRPTTDALAIIERRLTRGDAKLHERLDRERVNAEVAALILAARREAGLTQAQLAERVGTTQPAIARLEDATYTGHSLSMLQRIAAALGKRLDVRMRPAPKRGAA
jgi:ribosome-binding protein aMBF1 (putative translation factor)